MGQSARTNAIVKSAVGRQKNANEVAAPECLRVAIIAASSKLIWVLEPDSQFLRADSG